MRIAVTTTVKPLGQAQPGELIVHGQEDQSVLGIIVDQQETAHTKIAVLAGDDGIRPGSIINSSNQTFCLSYGSDWVLQPKEELIKLDAKWQEYRAPMFAFTEGGLHLLLFHQSDFVAFNLETSELTTRANEVAPITQWSIWRSSEALADPQSEPLLTGALEQYQEIGI